MTKEKVDANAKFEAFINKEPSKWIENAEWRDQNSGWLDRSFLIALKVIRELRHKQKNQAWLADQMQVSPQQISKLLKGKENLRLTTIDRLEKILNIRLIEIPGLYSNVVPAAEQCINCSAKYHKTSFKVTDNQEAGHSEPVPSTTDEFIVYTQV